MNEHIRQKEDFVMRISSAVSAFCPEVSWIEYRFFKDQNTEVVRIYWEDGDDEVINVSGCNSKNILIEIARVLNGQLAIGHRERQHADIIRGWWKQYGINPEN